MQPPYRALFDRANAQPGETVLVHGTSGGVGLAAVQLAAAHGCRVLGTASTKRGRIVVVGSRDTVEINPRFTMAKTAASSYCWRSSLVIVPLTCGQSDFIIRRRCLWLARKRSSRSYNPVAGTTNRVNEQQGQPRSEPMDASELRAQLEQLHPVSFGWALACCSRNPMEAEDILQTAYWKVLDGRARFDGRAAFKTWLFAVIRHTALDEQRRHWLRRLRLAGYREERGDAVQPAPANEMLDTALTQLPRRQQEVLHLVFYQDLTIEEAAGVMGVSLGSARTHYERGKQRLRELMHEP